MTKTEIREHTNKTFLPSNNYFLEIFLPISIISVGIALRLFHFYKNRSLWYDESHIALNLIYKNFIGLTQQPLYYDQHAPIGFLWISEAFTRILGFNEYALRLFPLLCGIASLICFYYVLRYIFTAVGINVALTCLAFGHPLIYHSVEAKQYEVELLVTILAFWSYFYFNDKLTIKNALIWGIIGGILIWFAHSVVFILASIGLILFLRAYKEGNHKFSLCLMIVFGLWGVNLLLDYVYFLSVGTEMKWLREHWERQDAFMPFPIKNLTDFTWFIKIFFKALDYPLGVNWQFIPTQNKLIRFSLLGFCFFILGMISLLAKEKKLFYLFLTPLLLLLIASALRKYPVLERLLVFAAPIFIIVIGYGAQTFYQKSKSYSKILALAVILIFVISPVFNSINHLLHPKLLGGGKQIDIRQAIKYITDKKKPNDLVYISSSFTNPYLYYKELYNFQWAKIENHESFNNFFEEDQIEKYKTQVDKDLFFTDKGKQVWFLLYPMNLRYKDKTKKVHASAYTMSGIIKEIMDKKGSLKDSFHGNNVEVYLYEFKNP